MKNITIGIAGNPNCGKTTLFNSLTGSKQRVGNWPGVTVDRKTGSYRFAGGTFEVIDTPGIYSLTASSLDEQVTQDFLVSREADVIVNIIDASNIERNLYLTSQILEIGVPVVIALNMMDMAKQRQLVIDTQKLAGRLGCPVVPMVASQREGIDTLKSVIRETAQLTAKPAAQAAYPQSVEKAVQILASTIADASTVRNIVPRWLALKLLEGDPRAGSYLLLGQQTLDLIDDLRCTIEHREAEEVDIVIASARYGFVSSLLQDAVTKRGQASASLSDRIDRVVLNRLAGIPLFLVCMYLMFMFTINLGGAFIDFFDQLAGAIVVGGTSHVLGLINTPAWLVTVLADGIGGGIQTMATFIPPIGFMFLCLSFLEDSGYMARAAFVMDRFMRLIGLPGKAFVPMLVGFGCNVPAIMATRTLEHERDRLLTVMMNPFMSCGARLPVYALFAAAFFPVGGQNLVFLLYLIGIGFAVLTGLILKNTVLKGQISPFIMEMPPYHLPTIRSVVLRAYDRLQSFLFKAGRVLVPVIMILSLLNSMGTDGSFGNEKTGKSALAAMSKLITPVLKPLGITEENWPATVGIFTGIFAKEAVVGTLDSLYASIDRAADAPAEQGKEDFDFLGGIRTAFATIPENLGALAGTLTDPLAISIGDVSDQGTAAEEQEVNTATYGAMIRLFGSQSAAFAYMLFILLYFPCSAAISAVYRETNLFWTLFAGFWTTFLAYLASSSFYQLANFSANPRASSLVLGIDAGAFVLVIFLLHQAGRLRDSSRQAPATGLAVRSPFINR